MSEEFERHSAVPMTSSTFTTGAPVEISLTLTIRVLGDKNPTVSVRSPDPGGTPTGPTNKTDALGRSPDPGGTSTGPTSKTDALGKSHDQGGALPESPADALGKSSKSA